MKAAENSLPCSWWETTRTCCEQRPRMSLQDSCVIKGENQRELMLCASDIVGPQDGHPYKNQSFTKLWVQLRLNKLNSDIGDGASHKISLTFEEMDESPMGGSACDSKTEKIPMGEHWKARLFMEAPAIQYPRGGGWPPPPLCLCVKEI